jgi:hypothetical protein
MVDLSRTEEQLLSEIEFNGCTSSSADPSLGARCRLVGRTPADLLPLLSKTFSTYYPDVDAKHLSRDLIDLVKKGLGNAYKWGNERDEKKELVVTTAMTRHGAVIKISDQGHGFDVLRVVTERSFTHGGSGLTRFRKTSSVITYADSGRTLLIRFLCDADPDSGGKRTRMNGSAPPNTSRIEVSDLAQGDQVKVKGVLGPDGTFVAKKVTVKPCEELAIIAAPLQQVQDEGSVIRILDLNVTVPGNTEVVDTDLQPAGFEQLRAGQVVWLSGRYVPGEGFAPVRIKIRRGRDGELSEVQGRIETIDPIEGRFRVAGVTIITDARTEVLSSVQAQT